MRRQLEQHIDVFYLVGTKLTGDEHVPVEAPVRGKEGQELLSGCRWGATRTASC